MEASRIRLRLDTGPLFSFVFTFAMVLHGVVSHHVEDIMYFVSTWQEEMSFGDVNRSTSKICHSSNFSRVQDFNDWQTLLTMAFTAFAQCDRVPMRGSP